MGSKPGSDTKPCTNHIKSLKNSEKFSISDLLEDYIAENGRTALEKVRKDICSSAGVNEHVFTIAYANSEKLLVDDDDYLLSIDDLDISREILSPVITKLEQLAETAAITVKQLFDENKVLCVKLNMILLHFVKKQSQHSRNPCAVKLQSGINGSATPAVLWTDFIPFAA